MKKKQGTDRRMMPQFYQRLRPQMEKQLCLLQQQNGDRAYPFRYLYYQEYLLGTVAHCNQLNSEAAGLISVVRDYTCAQDVPGH